MDAVSDNNSSSGSSDSSDGRPDSDQIRKRARKERSKQVKKTLKKKQKDKKKAKKRDKKMRKKEKEDKDKFEKKYGKLDSSKSATAYVDNGGPVPVKENRIKDSAAFRKEARQMFQKMAATIDLKQAMESSALANGQQPRQ